MRKWWVIFLIGFLIISFGSPTYEGQAFNFELNLIFPSENIEYDFLAQAVKSFWSPLFVNVQEEGLPRTSYLQRLNNQDYDVALISLEQQVAEYPPLWRSFSPTTLLGTYYGINSTETKETINIDTLDSFNNKIENYKETNSLSKKISLAKEIQQIYNEELLLDIPIVSPSIAFANWAQFTKFDAGEGIVGSLFLGAGWEENPEARARYGSTTKDLHYSILDFNRLAIPTYYSTRSDLTVIKTFFPSLFLKDKHNNLHPDLAISFNKTLLENGKSSWIINLRDNAKWTDGEIVDAYDIKFTLDVVSFDWSDATNSQSWSNLESVEILDNATLSITFNDNALDNKFKLANEYIIPEHILNVSGIYEGLRPSFDDTWKTFLNNPITAGPFEYNPGLSKVDEVEVFEASKTYWFPNEADSPGGIFNLTSGESAVSYYFPTDEIKISNLYFYPSSSVDIDKNTLITAFTSGIRDIIEVKNLSADSIRGDNFELSSNPVPGSGIAFLFNLENQRLANFDIRKALTHALDRSDLVNPFGLGAKVQVTPVSAHYVNFYDPSVVLDYNYETARNLFLANGYEARNNNTPKNSVKLPWQELSFNFLPMLSFTILLLTVILKRNRG